MNDCGQRRRWSAGQTLAVLQKWQTGSPQEKICRKHAVTAAQICRWKRSLDQVSRSPASWCPRVSWEGCSSGSKNSNGLGAEGIRIRPVKKPSRSKGSNHPRGHRAADTNDGLLRGHRLPRLGQAAKLIVLSAATRARAVAPATSPKNLNESKPVPVAAWPFTKNRRDAGIQRTAMTLT